MLLYVLLEIDYSFGNISCNNTWTNNSILYQQVLKTCFDKLFSNDTMEMLLFLAQHVKLIREI